MSLKGKTALVTGSTSGIGLGIAIELARQGAQIVMNGFGDVDAPRRDAGLVVAVSACLLAPVPAYAADTVDLYLVQGITGVTGDLVLDGEVVGKAAAPASVVGPLHPAPGAHVVSLQQNRADVVSARFTLAAGSSADVVVHRTADAARSPVVTVFPNDVSRVAPGRARLVVSHAAVAPAADVRLDGQPLFRNVTAGESLTLDLPAAASAVELVPNAGSGPAVLAKRSITLPEGSLTRVFAIGDLTAGTTDAVVQHLSVGTDASARVPGRVRTGDGGQAADSVVGGRSSALTWLGAGGTLMLGGLLLLNRRRTALAGVGSRHSR